MLCHIDSTENFPFFSNLMYAEWYSIVILMSISLIISKTENYSMCLLNISPSLSLETWLLVIDFSFGVLISFSWSS